MITGTLLGYALAYAKGGFPVLPLHSPADGACTCRRPDCGSVAKHPRTANGLADASTDADTIRRWWEMWPEANVGLAIPEGFVVVDVDVEGVNGALNGRDLPTTATAKTGKGWHFLYTTTIPVRPRVGVLEHVDLRGPGSYIVAPPSRHASGSEYVWVIPPKDLVAEAPAWVLESPARQRVVDDGEAGPIPAGQRNATLASLAGSMRRRGMGEAAILAALREENRARCLPPLDDDELGTIAHSVARYEPEQAAETPDERPRARPASMIDPAAALRDPWHIEGVARPGRLVGIASQEGVGKSQARLELALRLATGHGALFGHYPIPARQRVLLIDVENGEEEETRREEETLERLGLTRSELGDYWRVSLEGLLLTDPADQAYIRGEIERVAPAVVIFDTGSSMVGDEWGKELKLAVRFLRGLAREYGCTVVVAVHLVKASRQAKSKDAPEHGTDLADVMGQWTRQADSVALMARTKDDQILWSMRKRVPRSTLVLAPDGGVFRVVNAVVGGELGADTRAAVAQYIGQGVTDTAAIAQLLGVTRRTVQRHVAKLSTPGDTVSPHVAAGVAAISERETTPVSPNVADVEADQPVDVATLSSPPIRGDSGDMSPAARRDVSEVMPTGIDGMSGTADAWAVIDRIGGIAGKS